MPPQVYPWYTPLIMHRFLKLTASGLLEPVASGNVTVTVSQPGDSHFSAAASQTLAMKIIGTRPQTITFADY